MKEDILEIQGGIKTGLFPNEAAVSSGIVMRILQLLGWPVFKPNIVSREYSLDTLYVDYALFHGGKLLVLIEVKGIGKLEGADGKLFQYAFHAGAPLAILTDGQEWHFYLPAQAGSIGERRFYKLDILERNVDEAVNRLKRYLSYDKICSGAAIKDAVQDHQNQNQKKEAEKTISRAWKKLLEEENNILVDLLSEKTADMCGYKPDVEIVSNFIKKLIASDTEINPSASGNISRPQSISTTNSNDIPFVGFELNGKQFKFRYANEVLVNFIDELTKNDTSFIERFASRKHGSYRRYVAQTKEELYPRNPDLSEYSKRISNGWWVGTNYSKNNIRQIVELACEVANLRYGQDVKISL